MIKRSVNPMWNETLDFPTPSLKGILHLAVYHVEGRNLDFIGEGACDLSTFEEGTDVTELSFEQPLAPLLNREAYTLLSVLASREADEGEGRRGDAVVCSSKERPRKARGRKGGEKEREGLSYFLAISFCLTAAQSFVNMRMGEMGGRDTGGSKVRTLVERSGEGGCRTCMTLPISLSALSMTAARRARPSLSCDSLHFAASVFSVPKANYWSGQICILVRALRH